MLSRCLSWLKKMLCMLRCVLVARCVYWNSLLAMLSKSWLKVVKLLSRHIWFYEMTKMKVGYVNRSKKYGCYLNYGGVVADTLDTKLELSGVLMFSDLLVRSCMEFVHKVKLLYKMPMIVEKLVFLPHAMKMYLYLHKLDVTVD